MFIDSSAVMAILLDEPGATELLLRLQEQRRKPITSPLVRYEVVMSLARSRSGGQSINPEDVELATSLFDGLVEKLGCQEVMVTPKVGRLAVEASSIYGQMVGHPAKLNMGDCLSYATAKSNNVPLLYVGNNFAETDLA